MRAPRWRVSFIDIHKIVFFVTESFWSNLQQIKITLCLYRGTRGNFNKISFLPEKQSYPKSTADKKLSEICAPQSLCFSSAMCTNYRIRAICPYSLKILWMVNVQTRYWGLSVDKRDYVTYFFGTKGVLARIVYIIRSCLHKKKKTFKRLYDQGQFKTIHTSWKIRAL